MDPYTEKLLERTRQRREMLNQKLGKTPDPAPRKRILEENTAVTNTQQTQLDDDSPKRQCLRESEKQIKPDTPAISSVKSRLQHLAAGQENGVPGLSLVSDTTAAAPPRGGTTAVPRERKSRFAQLAQNINSWEDDLSHAQIEKIEERKPKWQPPVASDSLRVSDIPPQPLTPTKGRPVEVSKSRQSPTQFLDEQSDDIQPIKAHVPGKSVAPIPPAPVLPSPKKFSAPDPPRSGSPKKNAAPPPPGASPVKVVSRQTLVLSNTPASPQVRQHPIRQVVEQIPVNTRGLNETCDDLSDTDDEPTEKPVTDRLATWKQTDTPKTDRNTDGSLATKLAGWEQKVSQTPNSAVKSIKVMGTPRQMCTPIDKPQQPSFQTPQGKPPPAPPVPTVMEGKGDGDPAMQPVSVRMANWQQKTAEPPREEEPTAYPVNARMSAWEQMSSAGQVAHIKKVDPGSPKGTPSKQALPKPGGNTQVKNYDTPKTQEVLKQTTVPVAKPAAKLAPKKSFKDSILERAQQIKSGQSPVRGPVTTPAKQPSLGPSPSPAKVGSATKMMQQRLMEQTQHSQTDAVADKMRKERMAELQTLQSRWQNGILRENDQLRADKPAADNQQTSKPQEPVPAPRQSLSGSSGSDTGGSSGSDNDRRELIKAKARADFENKLAAMGFDVSDGAASFNFKSGSQGQQDGLASRGPPKPPHPPPAPQQQVTLQVQQAGQSGQGPPKPPHPPPAPKVAVSKQQVTLQQHIAQPLPPKGGSIYRLVTKKGPHMDQPVAKPQKLSETHAKTVQFDDSFDVIDESELRPTQHTSTEDEMEGSDIEPQSEGTETQESEHSDSMNESDSDFPESLRRQPQQHQQNPKQQVRSPTKQQQKQHVTQAQPPRQFPDPVEDEGDDVSMSAFVPASVRRESILPHRPAEQDTLSLSSQESFDDQDMRRPPRHCGGDRGRSTTNLVRLGQDNGSASSLTSEASSISQTSLNHPPPRRHHVPESDDMDSDDEEEGGSVDDFLDEAISDADDPHGQHRTQASSRPPVPATRKRRSHMMATTTCQVNRDNLVYSVSMYRSKRYNDRPSVPGSRIVRNSDYTEQDVVEENIPMPSYSSEREQRKSMQERIEELQELVSQEQSVIMQTSNALNQCCSGNSQFSGSAEQVECNRLLLISCQKRQSYLTEVQRLKETGQLEPYSKGPRGSLTISDIRLPLKKEFVTKIGTAQDNTVHYFVILIRNGPQLIVTQMLSTHDAMMRGSLDFPNLIKIHGISGDFRLTLEIYAMSISRESTGKDKKKKTLSRKTGKNQMTLQSPGGPSAVRTTSFTLITTLSLTMKSLDKTNFTLERIPYLSPLHGTIYMKLKCLMEQNVEERGFLTMFEDVSGLGAWHRRWCALAGNKLSFWKYPDDESKKEPMGFIDLKRCITEKVGLIPRDICARPNTFEMVTVRQPRRGEQDTLITKTYNTMTTMKHMMSADTKEERIVWCNRVNRALANLRTWHTDAMRPIKLNTPKK